MLITEKTLKDLSDCLKDKIGQGVCNKVGEKDIFQRAAQQINDNE